MTSQPSPATALEPRPVALDPRSLGRPVHLLPLVAQRLREALQRTLVQPWNRRYRSRYELQVLSLQPLGVTAMSARVDGDGAAAGWLRAQGPAGPLACRIDRALVLTLMARRLGLGADPVDDDHAAPPTATEERLRHLLAGQFAGLCLQWLAQRAGQDDESGQDLAPPEDVPSLRAGALPAFGPDAWVLSVSMRDVAGGGAESSDDAGTAPDMTLRLALDGAYLQPLLRRLSGQHRPARPAAAQTQPLARRLTLTLQARLLERELDLGTVLDLRPGALIPIRMADATVLVDGSALMSAAVAEHQGKLCLTSFQDLE
ncbi:hypothetical protein CDN99_01215 [Roseateles aquatilis]|uniref:Flagellar motor switch protein FliN-like C-terminal domain-containing protein n=1 Tax=Roseateles aquatilis TaxID=431061 RepID=A0A246JKT6_9BURK|nr:FliM/FliN family flagellar motor switch protein [Roseateles aquatilis]OWQ93150.1 hypothetical protein CDN99_01215 [Roseateles aquatilis]